MTGTFEEFVQEVARKAAEDVVEQKVASRLDRPGIDFTDSQATVTLAPDASIDDIPSLLAERGLKVEDWTVDRVTVNKWESAAKINDEWVTTQLRQLKVILKPSVAALFPLPARIEGPRYERPEVTMPPVGGSQLYVILPDQQIPHHDRGLHQLVCRWLDFNRPYGIICSGDLIDLPSVSKYRPNVHMVKDRQHAAQEGVDQSYEVLRDYVQASPSPYRKLIPGNHEERLQNSIIERLPELYDIKRAGAIDLYSVLSVPYLLRLDELGFDWVTAPNGAEWPDAQLILSDKLAVRHGWIAAAKSGVTALKTLDHLGYSVIVGHTHRQGQVYQTKHEIGGTIRTNVALEAGTLAEPYGLGYTIAPDWQQGFATVRVFSDGTFHASLATYVNGVLIWEGQRYFDEGRGVRVAA